MVTNPLAYAQRWRDFAAQVRPPLKEKELAKIFLKTLDQFYYENMVSSAPSNFTEMMTIGMRLEEGVREGRLVKESVPTNDSEGEDREVSLNNSIRRITLFRLLCQTPILFKIRVISPSFHNINNSLDNRLQGQSLIQFPVKYAELLPDLLERNLVQTRPPPPVPKIYQARFRADLSCDFHQGALGHDVERCYALKNAVQDLVEDNLLTFPDLNPNV